MSRLENGLKVTVLTESANFFLPDTLKVTGSTISTPKSYDEHPRHVKYGSPPPPPPGSYRCEISPVYTNHQPFTNILSTVVIMSCKPLPTNFHFSDSILIYLHQWFLPHSSLLCIKYPFYRLIINIHINYSVELQTECKVKQLPHLWITKVKWFKLNCCSSALSSVNPKKSTKLKVLNNFPQMSQL